MGDVPQLQQQQVSDTPVPGMRAPLDATGGGAETAQAFNAAGDLARTASDIAAEGAKKRLELSDLQVNYGAAAQLSALQDSILHDPKTGALNRHGDNAAGAASDAMEAYRKGAADIAQGLQTPRQKLAFQEQVYSHGAETHRIVYDHESKEQVNAANQTLDASAEQFRQSAIAKSSVDMTASEMDIARQRSALVDRLNLAGIKSGPLRDEALGKQESATRSGVIYNLLSQGRDLDAKTYFEAHKDKILDPDLEKVEERVRTGSMEGEAQRITDKLFSTWYETKETGPNETQVIPHYAPESESEAMDRIAEMTKGMDPKVRQLAENRANLQYHRDRFSRREQGDRVFQDVTNQLRKTQDYDTIQKSNEYQSLPENDKEIVDRLASRMVKQIPDGNDPRVAAQAVTSFYGKSREELQQMTPADMERLYGSGQVKGSEYVDMMKQFKAARQKEDDAEFKTTEKDYGDIFKAAHEAGLIDGRHIKTIGDLANEKNKDQQAIFAPIRDEIEAAWKAHFNDGKKLTQEDKKRITNDIVVDKVVHKPAPDSWWSPWILGASKDRINEMTGRTNQDIPEGNLEEIKDLIQKQGGTETPEKINRIFKAGSMKASVEELRKLARE